MNLDIKELQKKLCALMCVEITVRVKSDDLLIVETPFSFPDGDSYQIYIKELANGVLRLSDMGHTLMHLSYDNNIDKINEGTRAKILEQILSETNIKIENGEFYIDTLFEELGISIFQFAQAITKIYDIRYLNKTRVETTFYEDLQDIIYSILGEDRIEKDFYFEGIDDYKNYPIDYKIEGKYIPLYVFGVPNKDKARLTTIVLERLLRAGEDFDSLIIFSDQSSIPKSDLARLTNAGGEMIASLDARDDLNRKLMKRAS